MRAHSRPLVAIILASLALATLIAHAAPESEPALATVNGEVLTADDFARVLVTLHEGKPGATSRANYDVDKLAFRVINDTLLAQEARALEMHLEEPTRSQVELVKENEAVKLLVRELIAEKAVPSEEEVRAAFDREYRRVTLRVLTVLDEETAKGLRKAIEEGATFDLLARQNSIDPYAGRGGLVESLPRRDLIAGLREAAFDSEAGALGGPVLTDLGWTIFEVVSFDEPDPADFEGAAATLWNLERMRKGDALRNELARSIRDNHPVEVNASEVEAIVPKRQPDGRLRPEIPRPDAVIAKVGKVETITADALGKKLLSRWNSVRSEEAAVGTRDIILKNMIEEKLFKAEALARGYLKRPEVVAEARRRETEMLVQRYLTEVLADDVEVGEDDMRAHFSENKDRFRKPPRLHLGQVTVEDQDSAKQVAKLLADGADLAWVAQKYSKDRFATKGGDRGWYVPTPGTSDVDTQMMSSKAGDIFGPDGVPGNYVVVQVTAREERGYYTFREVSGNLREAVFSERFREALDTTVTALRERSEITINRDALEALTISGSNENEPEGGMGGQHGASMGH